MSTIKEKIEAENGKNIFCYKQGAFWVCYEQSAYMVCQTRAYQPTKKYVKACNCEVVSIGFPDEALKQWQKDTNLTPITATQLFCVLEWNKEWNQSEYVNWKNGLPLKEQSVNPNTPKMESKKTLEQRIMEFPLAHSTPVDTYLFIQKLQQEMLQKKHN